MKLVLKLLFVEIFLILLCSSCSKTSSCCDRVYCSVANPRVVRKCTLETAHFPPIIRRYNQLYFLDTDASVLTLYLQAIFTAGYKAVLHIHSVVEECEIVELLHQIDPKTKKPMKKKVLFVKTNAVVLCRIQVSKCDANSVLVVQKI